MGVSRRKVLFAASGGLATLAFAGSDWLVDRLRPRTIKYVSAFGERGTERFVAATHFLNSSCRSHLLASEEGLYYGFQENRSVDVRGRGIGLIAWNDLTKPKWEENYSNLFDDTFAKFAPKGLDLLFFNGKPAVSISGTGSLMVLDKSKSGFYQVGPAGFFGASRLVKEDALIATTNRGLVCIDFDGTSKLLAESPAGFPIAKSHLCSFT